MHRVFKKAVAGISALAMAATLSAVAAPVFAAENAQLESTKETLGSLLAGSEYASMEGISISEGTALRDLGSNTLIGNLYTVYHDSEVIGVVSELKGSDNQVLSTYHETDDVALQSAADTDTPVAFYRDGNAVMVYDGDTLTNVSNGEAVDAAPEQADLQKLEIADSDLAQYAMRATAMTYAKELPYFVDYCAKPSYDRYGNVSWACSIASKYNYKKQLKPTDAEALTTNEVFDRLVEMSGAQNPGGTASQIKDLLAVYRLRSTYQTGELSVEQVYKNLNQDNPVMIRMGVSTADAERFLEVDGLIFGSKYYPTRGEAIYNVYDGEQGIDFEAVVTTDGDFYDFYGEGAEIYTTWVATFSFR